MATVAPNPSTSTGSFFVTGGTLPSDAPSYVARQADHDLLASVRAGEFCYVLNTRQMGKSSLMIRTAAVLKAEGSSVVVLDLTAIGQNLTPAQWYAGMLNNVGEQLGLEDALDDYWADNADLGPLQRFMGAIGQAALPNLPGNLIIFVDEIDAVRSLPFAADEFFAGIRECYNRRTLDSVYNRLTFCLIGVATPADLISDTRMSPFNIGRRIQLTDFTPREATPLARGLAGGQPVVDRVLYWTNGHPYMTQRLCRAIADAGPDAGVDAVDSICERLFLTKQARETDDNLAFVRNRLLRSETDLAALLLLFERVRSGKRVKDDETNPLCAVLRLSGVVNAPGGILRVRNRIYDRVFDREWVRTHMPDAEVRRQREAFLRGVVRAAMGAAAIVLLLAVLALEAVHQKIVADTNAKTATRLLRIADLELAAQIWESPNGSARSVADLLETARVPEAGANQRFEWRYQWNQLYCASAARIATPSPTAQTMEIAVSSKGYLVSLADARLLAWTSLAHPGEATHLNLIERTPRFARAELAPTGGTIAIGQIDGTILIDSVPDLTMIRSFHTRRGEPAGMQYVSDGQLAVTGKDGSIELWNPSTGRLLGMQPAGRFPNGPSGAIIAVSGTGRWPVAVANSPTSGAITLQSLGGLGRPGYRPMVIGSVRPNVNALAFSRDGRTLAAGDVMGRLWLYDAATGKLLRMWTSNATFITAIAFSRDDSLLATGEWNGSVRLWSLKTPSNERLASFKSHTEAVTALSFSSDSRYLASVDIGGVGNAWDLERRDDAALQAIPHVIVDNLVASPDGKSLAGTTINGMGYVWDTRSWRKSPLPAAYCPQRRHLLLGIAYSPNGRLIATSGVVIPDGATNLRRGTTFVQVTDRRSGTGRIIFRGPANGGLDSTDSGLRSLAFSPDSTMLAGAFARSLAIGGRYNAIAMVWDVASGKMLAEVTGFNGSIARPAWSPNGKWLVLPCYDGTARRLETSRWTTEARLTERSRIVPAYLSAAFSPNGRFLALGDFAGQIQVWDTASWRLMRVLSGHSSGVFALDFSPDGQTLASASMDQTVKMWDVESGQQTRTLTGAANWLLQVAFAPDSSYVAASDGDGYVRLWRAATPDQVAAEAANASRPTEASASVLRWITPAQDTAAAALELSEIKAHVVPSYADPDPAGNLLRPVGGRTRWIGFTEPTSNAGASIDISSDDTITAHVRRAGPQLWNVQVYQTGINLVPGRSYVLQFRARADSDRAMLVTAERDVSPWDQIGLVENVNLTTDWRPYRLRFRATPVPANHGEIMFGIGDQTGTVQIADVVLAGDKAP